MTNDEANRGAALFPDPLESISVAGIDFRSPLEERERFVFSEPERGALLAPLRERRQEALMICTCNRTELWTVGPLSPAESLRQARGGGNLFELRGAPAVEHAFALAAGLRSQIPLDEQILAQMKKALLEARENAFCGAVLEQLFKEAIAAGKRVRAAFCSTPHDHSAAAGAVSRASELLGGLKGKQALVIGNGEMGMLCASLLHAAGARVWMTLRRHRRDGASAPAGVEKALYEDRGALIGQCDLVIGATSSPHCVVTAGLVAPRKKPLLCVDLAVPRDIDPVLKEREGVTVLDMDSLGCSALDPDLEADILNAINRAQARFCQWSQIHQCMPLIDDVRAFAEREIVAQLRASEPEASELRRASRLMIDKLLFSVKEKAGLNAALDCYRTMAKAVRP